MEKDVEPNVGPSMEAPLVDVCLGISPGDVFPEEVKQKDAEVNHEATQSQQADLLAAQRRIVELEAEKEKLAKEAAARKSTSNVVNLPSGASGKKGVGPTSNDAGGRRKVKSKSSTKRSRNKEKQSMDILSSMLDEAAISVEKSKTDGPTARGNAEESRPMDTDEADTEQSQSVSSFLTIPASSPLHFDFVCEPHIPVSVMGALHPCSCPIHTLTLGDVLPKSPSKLHFLCLKSLKITAGLLSVVTNNQYSAHQQVQLILEHPDQITLTEVGMSLAFRIFFSNCRHFELSWKDSCFLQNVKFDSVRALPGLSNVQLTNAFRKAYKGWDQKAAAEFEPPLPKSLMLLLPNACKRVSDLEVGGVQIVLYNSLHEMRLVIHKALNADLVLVPKFNVVTSVEDMAKFARDMLGPLAKNRSKLWVITPWCDSFFETTLRELSAFSNAMAKTGAAEVLEFSLLEADKQTHSPYHYAFCLGLQPTAQPGAVLAHWQVLQLLQALSTFLKGLLGTGVTLSVQAKPRESSGSGPHESTSQAAGPSHQSDAARDGLSRRHRSTPYNHQKRRGGRGEFRGHYGRRPESGLARTPGM